MKTGNPVGTANYDICEARWGGARRTAVTRAAEGQRGRLQPHMAVEQPARPEGRQDHHLGRRRPQAEETDPATPMYYNKDGGKKYHTTARCASVKSRYPAFAITYGDLSSYPYNQLSPCTTCGAQAAGGRRRVEQRDRRGLGRNWG